MAGASVAIGGRVAGKEASLAAELEAAGLPALGVAVDVKDVAQIQACTDRVAARFGALDLLVNCVGMQKEQRLGDVSADVFDEIVQVNLRAAMFLAQAASRWQIKAVAAGRAPGRHWLDDAAVRERLLQRIPLGRVAGPADVAGPVHFLCSEAARFVTGQVLYVGGGLSATQ